MAIALAAALAALGGLPRALAQVTHEPMSPHPDPSRFARGLYGEAEAGTLVFLGDAGAPLGAGAGLGARLGYDVFRWAALQLHGFGSTHTADFANRPQRDQLLQIYQGTAELKLTVRFGQLAATAFGGAGWAVVSSNLLETTGLMDPGVQSSPVLLGGAGVEYHTLSRHFSFGIGASYLKLQRIFTLGAVAACASVRYTF